MLTAPDRPTGIVCGGPAIAMFVKSTAMSLGLTIPDDISVIAYDDPIYLAMAYPPITTVRQPLLEMATKAVELLVERWNRAPQMPA
ncbi:substrate-binding domain-containing protein, partial [Klebsiella pneumoniae]|uniref:substrate-binding domain-containing protein n=1 Tax=Klebsiella pneumoniae TaxID=573 RepID=UPI003EE15352